MIICFLASSNSIHILKLCKWFATRGHIVHLISFEKPLYNNPYAKSHIIPINFNIETSTQLKKIDYLLHGKTIRKLIDSINPDIINVHFASSYGAAVALAGIERNYILSVWGSDVYSFPNRSFFHRKLLEYSLRNSSCIFSTSKAMIAETNKYTKSKILHMPFGVDTRIFSPKNLPPTQDFTIGIVKALNKGYGIEYLLQAAQILQKENPTIRLKLRIGGDGLMKNELKKMASRLNIDNNIVWLGQISQQQAAMEWQHCDVAVLPSEFESFGVAAIEAQSCAKPLIVSDAPGFLETTLPGISSIVVPRKRSRSLADAILLLYHNADMRRRMGEAGRQFILANYDINYCNKRIETYFETFNSTH